MKTIDKQLNLELEKLKELAQVIPKKELRKCIIRDMCVTWSEMNCDGYGNYYEGTKRKTCDSYIPFTGR